MWAVALALLGIILIAYGVFFSTPKIDPQLERYAELYPNATLSAVVFCNPCIGIEGEFIGEGKMLVTGKPFDLLALAEDPRVKQIRFLGKIE